MSDRMESLEGDGFIFNLFHFLWMKDPVLGFGKIKYIYLYEYFIRD